MKVAIYARVSTNEQTTQNQIRELKAWAKLAGHKVVAIYDDNGVSGAKGREYRKEFDRLLRGAVRREFYRSCMGLVLISTCTNRLWTRLRLVERPCSR
jgi:DNA invertase Pin-like site-specific DNA recombinase